jgi:hypothetical protein
MTAITPYMPRVDEFLPDDMGKKFDYAHAASLGDVAIPGHQPGQHYVSLLTPGRIVRPIPAPPANSMSEPNVQSILALLPLPPKRVVAVGFTVDLLRAEMQEIYTAIPFFGFLLGFAYIGHSVVLFEGHPSAFEYAVRGVDMLLVDFNMIPFLPNGWTAISFREMRTPEINVFNRHNPQASRVQRIISPSNIYDRGTPSLTTSSTESVKPAEVLPEPTTVDDLLKRAETYLRAFNTQAALDDLNRTIELEPQNAFLYVRRSFAYQLKGNLPAALHDMQEAITLTPDDAINYLKRSELYFKGKQWDEAIADCNEAIRLDPQNAVAFEKRASYKGGQHDYEGAVDDALQSLSVDPDYFWAYQTLAAARLHTGDVEQTLADIKAGRKLLESLQAQQKINALHFQAVMGRLKYLENQANQNISP